MLNRLSTLSVRGHRSRGFASEFDGTLQFRFETAKLRAAGVQIDDQPIFTFCRSLELLDSFGVVVLALHRSRVSDSEIRSLPRKTS